MQSVSITNHSELQDQSSQPPVLSEADLLDLLGMPPIDLPQLIENCMGESLFAVSLLEEFARTGSPYLEKFEQQLREGNYQEVETVVHGLRGVAGVLGAKALLEVNSDIENACKTSSHDRVNQLSRSLRQEVERVLQAIPSLCVQLRRRHDRMV